MFDDTKGVIRNRKLTKYRPYYGPKNNDLQIILQTIHRLSNTNHTKTESELRCPGRATNPCSTSDILVLFETGAKITIKVKNDSLTIYQIFIITLEKMILYQFDRAYE